MLLALVAMVQGNRVNQAVNAHTEAEAESQGEVIGSVHHTLRAKFAFANENRSGCTFMDIKDVDSEERGGLSIDDCEKLHNDKNIVAYAYGRDFRGKGQILAWSYLGAGRTTGSPEYLWAFYPKPAKTGSENSCSDRLKVTDSGNCQNTPGLGSCMLCPSCERGLSGWSYACNYEQEKFPIGKEVKLGSIVTATLAGNDAEGFRLQEIPGKDMDKRIYVCSHNALGGMEKATP